MILWLVQSTADHIDLAHGRVPPGLLGPQEALRLAGLRTPKRRHDWLLGRWTAKQLVRRYVERTTAVDVELAAIEIVNDDDGVPAVVLSPAAAAASGLTAGSVSLSISHCEELALCALRVAAADAGPGRPPTAGPPPVGADIERVRPRIRRFVTDYFTAVEIDQLAGAAAGQYDTLVTAIWSAKEAALKALHLGLTVDTRRVECRMASTLPDPTRWQPLAVTYRPYAVGDETPPDRVLPGWWRTWGAYVLTIVTDGGPGREPTPL